MFLSVLLRLFLAKSYLQKLGLQDITLKSTHILKKSYRESALIFVDIV